ELAAELVHLNVEVIVATGTLGPLAAKRATSTIPIVMTAAGDPLGSGLIANLAHPGGNVTGLSLMVPDIAGKRLELLKEILPRLVRVAVIWNAGNPYLRLSLRKSRPQPRDWASRSNLWKCEVPTTSMARSRKHDGSAPMPCLMSKTL